MKMSPLFIAALGIMIAITNITQNCNHYKLSKRVTELEEWWSAHHKAIGDTAAIWRRSKLETKWMDATAAIPIRDSGIVLQPGESFMDTITFSSGDLIYNGNIPSWQTKENVIDKWRRTFQLYPDTASVKYYHNPMDGEIIRVREEVLYVYSNGHWSKIEVKQ